jgi:chitinase
MAALALSGLGAFAQDSSTAKRIDKVFVGYVYRPPTNINFKLYTHLCHSFITADATGLVRTNRNVPSAELVTQAHRAGVKVILRLGGWG